MNILEMQLERGEPFLMCVVIGSIGMKNQNLESGMLENDVGVEPEKIPSRTIKRCKFTHM